MQKKQNDIQIYFIDLDGTTLDSKNNLERWPSKKNLEAIKNARARGQEVIISTGRSGQNIYDLAAVIGGKYFIQANGALITDKNNKTLFSAKLNVRQTLLLLDIIKKHHLAFKLDDQYVTYGVQRRLSRFVAKKAGWTIKNNYAYPMHQEYFKVVCFGIFSRHKIASIAKEIMAKIPDVTAVTSARGYSIEVTHKKATKGLAAEFIRKILKVPKQKTMHIGDSMNDCTVVGHVGKFVVMKNGQKALKKMASYCGPHYKNAGLAKILDGKFSPKYN